MFPFIFKIDLLNFVCYFLILYLNFIKIKHFLKNNQILYQDIKFFLKRRFFNKFNFQLNNILLNLFYSKSKIQLTIKLLDD
jgi:hypothetical protein